MSLATHVPPINPQSYNKLDENGNDLSGTATEWVMVRDNVTGLIWEVKDSKDDTPDYGNPHDADNAYNWQDAQDVFIAALNAESFGGYNDWRLPTVRELSFIINRDKYKLCINKKYFPNTMGWPMRKPYWSSTPYAAIKDHAWFVSFLSGVVMPDDKSKPVYVRAVRGRSSFQCFTSS